MLGYTFISILFKYKIAQIFYFLLVIIPFYTNHFEGSYDVIHYAISPCTLGVTIVLIK
jgi:hypothetical protein